MADTYSTNADLKFDNGSPLRYPTELTTVEVEELKDSARERAYNYINDAYLFGNTAIPATHIHSLKQVEVDLVIADWIQSSFFQETANESANKELYRSRAEATLQNLKFDAFAEVPEPDSQNVGNGTVTILKVNEFTAMTDFWTLEAQNATDFFVYGNRSGSLPNATVDVQYPEKDLSSYSSDYGFRTMQLDYSKYPFQMIINSGSIPFERYDRFTFKIYQSSNYRNTLGFIKRGG